MDRIFITTLLFALALFSLMAFVLPEYGLVGKVQATLDQRKALLVTVNQSQDRIIALSNFYASAHDSRRRLEFALPKDIENEYIITTINSMVSESGLDVLTLDIQAPTQAAFDFGDFFYDVSLVGVRFDVEGTMDQVMDLIRRMERSVRIYDVQVLDLAIADDTKSETVLSAGFAVNTYILKSLIEPTQVD